MSTIHQFIGRYYHALEQKGRLSIPVQFRKFLGHQAVITAGLDGCLFLMNLENWQALVDQTQVGPLTLKRNRDWSRYLANNAAEVSLDPQGRILIPEPLRQQAKLTDTCVIVGSLDRLEIWDQASYHHYLDQLNTNIETIAESISL